MRRKLKDPELTTKDISYALQIRFHNHRYIITNAYIYDWESDFFSVTESNYVYEVEVKKDKRDYKDDFNKTNKHLLLESQVKSEPCKIPNKFFYAYPKGMIPSFEIPDYAGILEIDPYSKEISTTREAPFLHKEPLSQDIKNILLDKYYFRYRDMLLKEYSKKQLEA